MPAIKVVPITSEQRRKWIETRSALLWKCPAFTHILFSMLNPTQGELAALFTDEIPIAATDGSNLILNPVTFFQFPLAERVFIVAHEIMHCILNHCALAEPMRRVNKVRYVDGRELTYEQDLMNKAMDYVINDTLVQDKVGTFPTIGLHDPSIGTQADSFMDVYRKLWEDDQGKGGKANGPGKGGGFDVILAPGAGQGKDPTVATQERSQTEWNTAVAAARASAKAQGKLPASLERLLSEVMQPTVMWQDHIRAFFARKVGSGSYDWRKPDRALIQRDIYHPRRSGNGCGEVVVAIDTSGSIGQTELNAFFAEMNGILEDVRPTKIYVVWCDAKVHKVDEVDSSSDIQTLKPHGGGGTDFRPVFDWVDQSNVEPEALVYLTDGMGSFPDRAPRYPVVWGSIYPQSTYPWGDVVNVKLK
jgi:predicted metal-dependent peptidase